MPAPLRRRFLFLYSNTGGGHRAAALAVRAALLARYGAQADVTLCDGLHDAGRWPFDRFPGWWPAMVRLGGVPWRSFYKLTNRPAIPAALARLLLPYTAPALERLLAKHPAEVIVSFHPLFTHTIGALLSRRRHAPPLASVVLDLVSIHAAWCAPTCTRIFAPTLEAGRRMITWGMPPEQVQCTGLPVHPRFAAAAHFDVNTARTALGLPLHVPIIMVTGGGDASGPLPKIIQAVTAQVPHAQVVVIAGKNARLKSTLARQRPTVRVEGFVENMEMWMRASDVLMTKAGPNTLAEALVMGLPLVLYQAIPGQETGNVDWITAHGAGLWAPRPARAAAAVAALLADEPRRAAMRAAALELARPAAAATIAETLWNLTAGN